MWSRFQPIDSNDFLHCSSTGVRSKVPSFPAGSIARRRDSSSQNWYCSLHCDCWACASIGWSNGWYCCAPGSYMWWLWRVRRNKRWRPCRSSRPTLSWVARLFQSSGSAAVEPPGSESCRVSQVLSNCAWVCWGWFGRLSRRIASLRFRALLAWQCLAFPSLSEPLAASLLPWFCRISICQARAWLVGRRLISFLIIFSF